MFGEGLKGVVTRVAEVHSLDVFINEPLVGVLVEDFCVGDQGVPRGKCLVAQTTFETVF